MSGTVSFDIETHEAGLLYTLPPEEFFRLGGYKRQGDKEVTLTSDLEELREVIRSADTVVGHNIHSFDLPAVFGIRSDEPLEMAMDRRVFDTWTHAVLVNPAPSVYLNRHGKASKAEKPEQMKAWFSLDEQAYQLGVPGKTADLKALALEFGNPDLPHKERIKDGFGNIPLTDERFMSYLVGDVLATEAVARALLKIEKLNDYAYREFEIEARKAVIQANGFRVDKEKAQARVDELAARREVILAGLQERYGLPTEGAAPWDTDPGKRAILAALADQGITPKKVNWAKTPVADKRGEKLAEVAEKVSKSEQKIREWEDELAAGELPERSQGARKRWIASEWERVTALRDEPLPPYFGLSLSGDVLKEITAGTPAEGLGQALAELKGQRSLAQLALDSTHADGFVHPEITMLQRSGRWSTTNPGLTVWTARGPGAVEKSYFLPDTDDEVLLEIDYSNADARAVAAMSGDKKFAERFEPGSDGHLINAWAAWGKETVGTDKEDPVTANYRYKAKALGHGWNYGGQAKTLSTQAGLPLEDGKTFCNGMDSTYKTLVKWQNKIRRQSQKGFVVNEWGRKMFVEKGREFTQAPALMGQSTTREIVCDALLAMPFPILRRVKAQIHDALTISVPKAKFERYRDGICQMMVGEIAPKGGQHIAFPVDAGPAGDNWWTCGH